MQKLFALVLILFGISTGVAAGLYFKPTPAVQLETEPVVQNDHAPAHTPVSDTDFLKLDGQFLIPLIDDKAVRSMVAMTLELEIELGSKDGLYSKAPKLRDAFLQIMFDHANAGGFSGRFTDSSNMDILKTALLETGKFITNDQVISILITDIARQDF